MSEERRQRLIRLGSAAAFLGIVAVAVAIVISQSQSSGGDTSIEDIGLVSRQLRGIPQEGMILGNPGAKATLVEFGDLQCPVCKDYAEHVLSEVIAGPVRRGEAKIDFRNYTIIGPQSTDAGAAAIAAGMQGRGWSFVELFYRNQGIEGTDYVTDEFLIAIARGAGVPDIAKWNVDRRSQSVLRQVARTTDQASSLGFTGTPSFAVHAQGGPLDPIGTPGSAEEIESALQQAS